MGGAVLHKLPGRARGGGVRPLRDRPRWGGERSNVAPRRLQLVENCGRGGGRPAQPRHQRVVRCTLVTCLGATVSNNSGGSTHILSMHRSEDKCSSVQTCFEKSARRLEWNTILGRLAESAMDARRDERLKRTAPRQVAPEGTSRGKLRQRAPVQGRCGSPGRPGGRCQGGLQ